MEDMIKLFGAALHGIIEQEIPSQQDSRYLGYTEGVSVLERLAVETVTGNGSYRPVNLYRHFGLLPSLERRGWPWINPERLNLQTFDVDLSNWPRKRDGKPYYSQIPVLRYHYNGHIADSQEVALSSLVLPYNVETRDYCIEALRKVIEMSMIPELRHFWVTDLEKQRRTNCKNGAITAEVNEECEEFLVTLKESDTPFSLE
jgi:hypothetical protein